MKIFFNSKLLVEYKLGTKVSSFFDIIYLGDKDE